MFVMYRALALSTLQYIAQLGSPYRRLDWLETASVARLTRAPIPSMRLATELKQIGGRVEMPDMRRTCKAQMLRAAARCTALEVVVARMEAASMADDALLVPPAVPWVETSAFGQVRAAARELNAFPPQIREKMHKPRVLLEHLRAEVGPQVVRTVPRDRTAPLLGAPLREEVVAIAVERWVG